MAEWLGHLMSGWPVWLIAVAVVIFIILIGIFQFYWSAAESFYGIVPGMRRKKHGKK
jgi:hypothetical protein